MIEADYKQEVGNRLTVAIEALRLSKAEVARQFHVSPSKLGHWCAGRHYPDPFFLLRFCTRHNVTMDWIWRGMVTVAMDGALADALWAALEASPPTPEEAERQAPASAK